MLALDRAPRYGKSSEKVTRTTFQADETSDVRVASSPFVNPANPNDVSDEEDSDRGMISITLAAILPIKRKAQRVEPVIISAERYMLRDSIISQCAWRRWASMVQQQRCIFWWFEIHSSPHYLQGEADNIAPRR